MRRGRTRLAGLLVALAAVGGAAACTADSTSGASAPPERAAAPVPGTGGAREGKGSNADAAETGAAPAAPTEAGKPAPAPQVAQPGVDRKLVRTATLDVTSKDVAESADRARGEVVAVGGYAGQEQVSTRSATLTLFVPSDKLDAFLGRLTGGDLGVVRSRNQTAEDVTEQVVDVGSRIETQRASLNRVRALLDRATGISEVVQLESEVTRREADLESLLKRREALAGSVAMSTVTLRLSLEGAPTAPVAEEDGFLDALAAGWTAFLDAGNFVLRVVGTLLPFAAVSAIPAFLFWRAAKRRRAARAAWSAQAHQHQQASQHQQAPLHEQAPQPVAEPSAP